MEKSKFSAKDVANWFLWKNKINQIENISEYDEYEVYESLTHLKLQKLVYYTQGIYLAFTDKPLFSEKIEAWEHGPVIKRLYDEYKKYKRDDINKVLSESELEIISNMESNQSISTVLNFVYDNFGGYTAWQLRQLSHIPNGPWEMTVKNKGLNQEISNELMQSYFKKYVKENG